MKDQRDQSRVDALDRLIEARRRDESGPEDARGPASGDNRDLARIAATLESHWREPQAVDQEAIWQRINSGMGATRQSPASRWRRFPPGRWFPPALPSWLTERSLVVAGTAATVLVLAVAALNMRGEQRADPAFVNDVESLARFTAAVLNDSQLSMRERGEVERRASGLLSTVQANPSVIAGLDESEAELVVSRIDSILTLLEPYENDEQGGVETSIVPLASVREQVRTARAPGTASTATLARETATSAAPMPTASAAARADSATPEPRGAATPGRTPDAPVTPRATATPSARLSPDATPPGQASLRELCGNERESRQARCRSVMAQLESACERDQTPNRCREAFGDALAACATLADRDAATCQRVLLVLFPAVTDSGSEPRRERENPRNDERPNRGGDDDDDRDDEDESSDTDRRRNRGDDQRRQDDDANRDDDRRGREDRDDDRGSDRRSNDDDDDDRDDRPGDRGRLWGRGRGGGSGR